MPTINLIINREVTGNYCLCAVSSWTDIKDKLTYKKQIK